MVLFCGNCHRQWGTDTGDECPDCGSIMVEWDYDGGESEEDAVWRWKEANGKMFEE
jgi:rRNA maturation endonuclease Nob1